MTDSVPLQVLVTHGAEDVPKVRLGLHTALIAASAGVEVTVFFTLRGTLWSCADGRGLSEAEEIGGLLSSLVESGAELQCCSACLEEHCLEAARDPERGLRPDIRLAGLASVARRASSGANTLTF